MCCGGRLASGGILALALLGTLNSLGESAEKSRDILRLYIGTYTQPGKSQGIYVLDLDTRRGQLSAPRLAAAAVNPSFLAIHPNGRFLYAVSEVDTFRGEPTGAVLAFALREDGTLQPLNEQPSQGTSPCHLIVDRTGRYVLAVNYGSGTAVVLPLDKDGSLGQRTGYVRHQGHSVNKERQEGPHCHSINLDHANRFALIADLGLDQILIYRFDADKGALLPHMPPGVRVAAGAGPRHFAFHPSGKFGYVINELNCTITVFAYDGEHGTLTEIQTLSTLPGPQQKGDTTAEVQVHPSGKFLYGSNRGHNSIAVFALDPDSGKLTRLENVPTGGRTPRNFGLTPDGRWLIVANQDSDNLVVFRIHPQTGRLEATGQTVAVPRPVCVRFVPRP